MIPRRLPQLVLLVLLVASCGGGNYVSFVAVESSFEVWIPEGCSWPDCPHPTVLGVGDFDGDGHRDVLAGGPASGELSLLLGNGRGRLDLAAPIQGLGGSGVDLLAVGFFDADGLPDVALVDVGANALRILRGDGAGGFAPAPGSPFPLVGPGLPTEIVVGPIAGGSRDDLLVVDDAGYGTVLFTAEDGALSMAPSSPFRLADAVGDVALADFDEDALPDLAVGDTANGTVRILAGDGEGGFALVGLPTPVGPTPIALVPEFLDPIRTVDLAVLDATGSTVHVLRGRGDGTFYETGEAPVALAAGTGVDLVPLVHPTAPNYPAHLVAVLRRPDGDQNAMQLYNPGDGNYGDGGTPRRLRGPGTGLTVVVLSEDGVSDFVWPDPQAGLVRSYVGPSTDL